MVTRSTNTLAGARRAHPNVVAVRSNVSRHSADITSKTRSRIPPKTASDAKIPFASEAGRLQPTGSSDTRYRMASRCYRARFLTHTGVAPGEVVGSGVVVELPTMSTRSIAATPVPQPASRAVAPDLRRSCARLSVRRIAVASAAWTSRGSRRCPPASTTTRGPGRCPHPHAPGRIRDLAARDERGPQIEPMTSGSMAERSCLTRAQKSPNYGVTPVKAADILLTSTARDARSPSRISPKRASDLLFHFVAGAGFEPATSGRDRPLRTGLDDHGSPRVYAERPHGPLRIVSEQYGMATYCKWLVSGRGSNPTGRRPRERSGACRFRG